MGKSLFEVGHFSQNSCWLMYFTLFCKFSFWRRKKWNNNIRGRKLRGRVHLIHGLFWKQNTSVNKTPHSILLIPEKWNVIASKLGLCCQFNVFFCMLNGSISGRREDSKDLSTNLIKHLLLTTVLCIALCIQGLTTLLDSYWQWKNVMYYWTYL